ncbi:Cell division protein FtsK [Chondromyces apiculatus DSM 436]|uniref:Cell division protein FtsK n=1 Tax=Chondromyces apiculatus DSM 436 TaxID=1192034 RepID=A0A017T850_9BACT|nr:Cell division protein FtsK [Chondromyces apiculatus DSM 436]
MGAASAAAASAALVPTAPVVPAGAEVIQASVMTNPAALPAAPSAPAGTASPEGTAGALASAAPEIAPPCPADMSLVGTFCVDRWEAHLVVAEASTNGEGVPLAAGSIHPHAQRPEAGVKYEARSAPGVFPQAFISRVEAKAACVTAGKRLCARREWLRACRGKGTQRYPYGNRGQRGTCATGKPHLLSALFGEKKRGWTYEEFNSPRLALEPGFLAKAGEYEGCVSDLGVHDMVGNLHEWVGDMVDQELMDRLDGEEVERRKQPWREGNGVFMGGFFSTTSELGPGCYYTTVAHEPGYHDYSTGFRCCDDATLPPPPAKDTRKARGKKPAG